MSVHPQQPQQPQHAPAQSSARKSPQRVTGKRRCDPGRLSRYEAWNTPHFKSFADGDPPFFLRHNTSSVVTNAGANRTRYANDSAWGDMSKGTMHTDVDSTVRSIIDDLTVENKMLRARNKSLERMEKCYREVDKHKLFEISLHNLPPSDARDLEEVVTAFVLSRHPRDRPVQRQSELSEANVQSKMSLMPAHNNLITNKNSTHASGTSKLDSGYASMTLGTPGPGSTPHNISPGQRKDASLTDDAATYSHLLDVPRGLLPGQSCVTTERSKKKLVVQRLEELFTGKKLLLGRGNPHMPDRKDNSSGLVRKSQKTSVLEGAREATIMAHVLTKEGLANAGEQETESAGDGGTDSDKSSEQRPTRPFDLDPERQQIPSENVDYMRHLGISTPDLRREDSQDSEADARGWVYLNLLMNMAQLHIMNVTADFVRDAVEEVSSNFQLSSDGSRLRWRGGTEPTQMSSLSGSTSADSLSAPNSPSPVETADNHVESEGFATYNLPRANPKKGNGRISGFHDHASMKGRRADGRRERHVAHYSPMFEQPSRPNTDTRDSSGVTHSTHVPAARKRVIPPDLGCVAPSKKQKLANNRARGMVFYDDASFFVDFGGAVPSSKAENTCDYTFYGDDRRRVLGCEGQHEQEIDSLSGEYLTTRKSWDRLLIRDSVLRTPSPITPTKADSLFDCNLSTPMEDVGPARATPLLKFPVQLEASGLGSTAPADHFLETVTTRIAVSDSLDSKQNVSSMPFTLESAATFESPSNDKQPQHDTRHGALDSLWRRIQLRKAYRHPHLDIFPAARPRGDHARQHAEDEGGSSLSQPTHTLTRANLESMVGPIVRRNVLDIAFQRLEPSSLPRPGLYFSPANATTESGTGEGSSELHKAADYETVSGDSQSNLMGQRSFRRWRGNIRAPSSGRGTMNPGAVQVDMQGANLHGSSGSGSEDTTQSSGCGDEEGEDESIDMLRFAREADPNTIGLREREWDEERARQLEEKARDEVISVEAVNSPGGRGSLSDGAHETST